MKRFRSLLTSAYLLLLTSWILVGVYLNPLSFGIDPCQCYHCADDGPRRDFHFINPFDESLERGTQIPPPLIEKAESIGVAINACSVCEAVSLC